MPLSGTSFYRIRNNDIDGKSGLSNIVKINLNKNIKTIGIYPNPINGNTTCSNHPLIILQ